MKTIIYNGQKILLPVFSSVEQVEAWHQSNNLCPVCHEAEYTGNTWMCDDCFHRLYPGDMHKAYQDVHLRVNNSNELEFRLQIFCCECSKMKVVAKLNYVCDDCI